MGLHGGSRLAASHRHRLVEASVHQVNFLEDFAAKSGQFYSGRLTITWLHAWADRAVDINLTTARSSGVVHVNSAL